MSFRLLKDVDNIDGVVFVFGPNVLPYIGLDLAHVVAVGTLEPGQLTALIAQMTHQVSLPREDAPTI